VLPVTDLVLIDGAPGLVMDLVTGPSLSLEQADRIRG